MRCASWLACFLLISEKYRISVSTSVFRLDRRDFDFFNRVMLMLMLMLIPLVHDIIPSQAKPSESSPVARRDDGDSDDNGLAMNRCIVSES